MKVREATIVDASAIARLAGQLGYLTTPAQAGDRLIPILQEKEHAVYVAELPDRSIVGWIHIFGTCYLVADPFQIPPKVIYEICS